MRRRFIALLVVLPACTAGIAWPAEMRPAQATTANAATTTHAATDDAVGALTAEVAGHGWIVYSARAKPATGTFSVAGRTAPRSTI